MVEQQIVVLLAHEIPHGGVVGREDGRLPELEQRRNQFISRNKVEKLPNNKNNKKII